MPDNPPPTYKWTVSLFDGQPFSVEAAYPVLGDDGYMLLKDSDHKIVFAASSGTACSFTRNGLAAAPGPVSVTGGFPANCACTYTGTWRSGVMAGQWARNVSMRCTADHSEIDRVAVAEARL